MSSLLAILLVVNSTRGHHYLFSYPPDPKRLLAAKRNYSDHQTDFAVGSSSSALANNSINLNTINNNNSNNNTNSNGNSSHSNSGSIDDTSIQDISITSDEADIFAGRDTIFNFDVSFLADALAPKSPLCDRKFQLSIDDLTFVGHPVSLSSPHHADTDDSSDSNLEFSASSSTVASTPLSHTNSPLPSLPHTPSTSSIHMNSKRLSLHDSLEDQFGHSGVRDCEDEKERRERRDREESSDIGEHKADAFQHSSENSSDSSDDEQHDDSDTSVSETFPGSTSIHMTLFHVVFVMSPPDLELNAQVDTLYKNVILRYSSALRYEQLRCGYVQEEIEKVLGLKEEALNKGTPYLETMGEILRESSLARDIKQIYTAISSNTAAHVIINDFIDLSLQIPTIGNAFKASSFDRENMALSYYSHQAGAGANMPIGNTRDHYVGSSLMDIYSVAGYEYDNYPVLCPYHTLLLLEDPEEVLKNMPLDASPTLVQLVQILTPTQSLQELHLLLDCSLAQIYRLAAHLIYWRKAKLIHTISTRNIYVVSPHAKLDDMASLEADFKSHIPNLSLPVLLSKLQHAQQYHLVYHVKELKNQYLEAITYLIRKDLVVQLHMYLVLLVPPEKKAGVDTPQSQYDTQLLMSVNEQGDTTNPTSSPNNNNHTNSNVNSTVPTIDPEWNRIKRATYERAPKEVAELFERLRPYMNGQHHIEEVIYREGVSRRQLGLVLKYYRDKIVTVYHY
ncbi:Nitrogen permease regulator 3 [Choanephora cucurbitarum]|uniref:Nitrogen permease regulator 3 n=1 Tax=Choanephora cucurbitarum TaxID=101091 RepID=A0A1C7N851_9FUNG|nr:Nitrogen permease regulator 3 [Choanephora cucurbitarum]